MNNYMDNYLHGTDIYLYQRKDMFRANTDTCLLGMFMEVNQEETVLDIGTNNGALLLYASRFHPKHLIGVDVLEEAIELARINLTRNEIPSYELHCGKIQEYEHEAVDVILSNPPYFPKSETMSVNEYLLAARHESYLSLEELLDAVERLLKDTGRFYLVHRANRYEEILEACREYHLYPSKVQMVKDRKDTTPITVLMEIKKEPCEMVLLHEQILKE